MPELPEVETIKIQLSAVLPGLTIKAVEVRTAGVFRGDQGLLRGISVKGLRRLGKMLVIDLTGNTSLAVHLGMSGRLVFENFKVKSLKFKVHWDVDYPRDPHTHVVITFKDGSQLYYHDQRKFGWLHMVPTRKVANLPYVAKLGPEFLSTLTRGKFDKIMRGSSRPIKLVLMDQKRLAGVGNIYANESLWCAKIHPKTKAKLLSHGHIATLFTCLEKILR